MQTPFAGLMRSCLLVHASYSGRAEDARSMLSETIPETAAAGAARTWGAWTTLLAAAEALAVLGDSEGSAQLYPLILEAQATGAALRFPDLRLLETVAGITASAARRWPEAEQHFRTAWRQAQELPQRIEQTEVRRFWAQMLIERGRADDHERTRRMLSEAASDYRHLGMAKHADMARALLVRLDESRTASISAPRAGPGTLPTPEATFSREGEYWTIGYENELFRTKDTIGLHYLAHLLGRPGTEVHVIDLVTATRAAGRPIPSAVSHARAEELDDRQDLGDLGPVLDTQARTAYERRIAELRDDVVEAERWDDAERASRAREELDALSAELGRAIGLGGRDRRAGSSAERARIAVTKAIGRVLTKLAANSPRTARHLAATVRTGAFCSYTPDPSAPVVWKL